LRPWTELIPLAESVRANAYAPYSDYFVGCALVGSNGKIYLGCNVENASYPLSVCAERHAIAAMVADGCTTWTQVLVRTEDRGSPCGGCRQVLNEFAESPDSPLAMVDDTGNLTELTMRELLPHAFVFRKSK
jgi:cytidine deaminase